MKLKRWVNGKIKAKKMLLSLYFGWRTRKIVNCLSKEIQDYVNCDEGYHKMRLKTHFQVLFDSVVKNQLWLQCNQFRL